MTSRSRGDYHGRYCGASGGRGVLDGFVALDRGHAVTLGRPRTQDHGAAALGAERPVGDSKAPTAPARRNVGALTYRTSAVIRFARSQAAERELEVDVALARPRTRIGASGHEADVESVLVGADLGYAVGL